MEAGEAVAAADVWGKHLDDLPLNEPQLVVDAKNELGEGVTWCPRRQAVLWLDIVGKKLHSWEWKEGPNTPMPPVSSWDLPKVAGSFCLTDDFDPEDSAEVAAKRFPFIMCFEDGFALYNHTNQKCRYLDTPYRKEGNIRLNDGRTDRQGRVVCGAINLDNVDEPLDKWEAKVKAYCVGVDSQGKDSSSSSSSSSSSNGSGSGTSRDGPIFKAKEIIVHHTFRNYNGGAFSPDGRTMYCTGAFDYDTKTGEPNNQRTFAQMKAPEVADGATIDSEGCLLTAAFWGGKVLRFSPQGEHMTTFNFPKACRTTCPCIGGPKMDTLFVTSGRVGTTEEDRAKHPWDGGLIAVKLDGITGIPYTAVPFDSTPSAPVDSAVVEEADKI